jgi:acetyl esterase
MLTDKLKAAGNGVTHKVYGGVTHEFFGMDAVVAKAKEAQDFARYPSLRKALEHRTPSAQQRLSDEPRSGAEKRHG